MTYHILKNTEFENRDLKRRNSNLVPLTLISVALAVVLDAFVYMLTKDA
jgi:hypothetical protein